MIFISLILFPCLRSLKQSLCDLLFVGMLLFRKVCFLFVVLEKTLRRVLLGMSVECIKTVVGRGPSKRVLALNCPRNQISKIPSKSINQKVFYFLFYTMHRVRL